MQQQTRGLPALQVSRTARWTLFAAGYARAVTRQGTVGRYLTTSPSLAQPFRPTKDEWWREGPAEPRSILRR